ncbi:PLP-dependent aspartate aminotransferase family protein [Streptomyces sp. PTM05]|uniref:PLP-dependent aspartate aminotransferase family protein n=1 Tax=Streptantibioticus parmotrematis TaxID=2873249 RepID=A0ABS7QJL7_9ACTN|nr:PLP-dependent aspartate aminotransferase family protein [Streptantibioticus parmotrematis]MBY8883363.1 PLP-dependent aspartate aminotransferase family protein [Streptantibioticus parmotrematis]
MTERVLSLDSLAVHAGREDFAELGVHAPPLDLSSTSPLPDIEAGGLSYESMATGGHPAEGGGFVYARLWNPTVARFEAALARLEHTTEAVAYSSGMAAMTAAVLAAKQRTGGRHVVAVRPLYGGTDHLLGSGLLDVEVTYCTAGEVAGTVRDDTCLVVVETPANPTLDLVDIRAVADAAGDRPLLVDNTFATPVLQNPADHGAALVLHSATKYLGGHGDVIAGVIATDAEWAAALRRVRAVTGGLLHPLAGYLLHRGLTTLPVRVRTQQASAEKLAGWLATHPAVREVFFPGTPQGDPAGLIGRQMRGPGAMLAVRLHGGYEQALRMTGGVRLFTHAVSLGGVDSLIQHPAALTHRPVPADARPDADIVRLSVGLEDPDDLCADLEAALTGATG